MRVPTVSSLALFPLRQTSGGSESPKVSNDLEALVPRATAQVSQSGLMTHLRHLIEELYAYRLQGPSGDLDKSPSREAER